MHARILTAAITATTVITAVVAPTAAADNQSYLAAVGPLSKTYPAEGLLGAGKRACYLLGPHPGYDFGIVAPRVADKVWQEYSLLERDQAALLVNAAIDNLCPGTNFLGQRA